MRYKLLLLLLGIASLVGPRFHGLHLFVQRRLASVLQSVFRNSHGFKGRLVSLFRRLGDRTDCFMSKEYCFDRADVVEKYISTSHSMRI